MKPKIPTYQQIFECQTSPWDFGNRILYHLCAENFFHQDKEKVIAKVWLIGRAYATAIERRKKKEAINDDFYIDHVAPAFINSNIDKNLTSLRNFDTVNSDNLSEIVATHYELTKLAESLTDLEKRSFSSKYLHFHLPDLFFIYDSRVVSALRQFVSEVPFSLKPIMNSDWSDKEYCKFACKCLALKMAIQKEYNIELKPRHLDNILIKIANQNLNKPYIQ